MNLEMYLHSRDLSTYLVPVTVVPVTGNNKFC